jgi:alpha-L-fucosidase
VTPEYTSPAGATKYKWEAARGLGHSFSYNACEGEAETLSAAALVHLLADVVSKNGNLLIGVGPRADGTIPERQRARLTALGAWLDVHGEAIFATRPWRQAQAETGDGRSLRFTRRGEDVYAIVLAAARPGELTLPLRLPAGATVQQLGVPDPLAWRSSGTGISLALPADPSHDQPAHAFRITPEPAPA